MCFMCNYMFSVVNISTGSLFQEFEAYKTYSSDLLTKEKELNAKLRHMINWAESVKVNLSNHTYI